MKEITLQEYIKDHGQTATALRLGLTQGAIWQMIDNDRDITITEKNDGSVSAYERKPIGTRAL